MYILTILLAADLSPSSAYFVSASTLSLTSFPSAAAAAHITSAAVGSRTGAGARSLSDSDVGATGAHHATYPLPPFCRCTKAGRRNYPASNVVILQICIVRSMTHFLSSWKANFPYQLTTHSLHREYQLKGSFNTLFGHEKEVLQCSAVTVTPSGIGKSVTVTDCQKAVNN